MSAPSATTAEPLPAAPTTQANEVQPAPAEPAIVAPVAEGAHAPAVTNEPPRERRKKGVHEHDGFYARLGIGFSGFGDTVVSEATAGDTFRDQGLISGLATVGEAAVGGTIAPGFVLGGGAYTATLETPYVYDARGRPVPQEFRRPDTFSVVGLMADLYPHPRRGLHIQAAIGLGALSGLNPGTDAWRDRHFAFGFGGMLGIGYEWWVGEQWGIGILGRATAGALAEDDAIGERWFHFVSAWPSLLFTVTYH